MENIIFIFVGILIFFILLLFISVFYIYFNNQILYIKYIKEKNKNIPYWQLFNYSPERFEYKNINYDKNDPYILTLKQRMRAGLKYALVGLVGVIIITISIAILIRFSYCH